MKTLTIEIPCEIGTRVWFLKDRNKKEVIQTTVEKIVLKSSGLYLKLACNAMYETSCRSIGKTIFFSEEAAEKALE